MMVRFQGHGPIITPVVMPHIGFWDNGISEFVLYIKM